MPYAFCVPKIYKTEKAEKYSHILYFTVPVPAIPRENCFMTAFRCQYHNMVPDCLCHTTETVPKTAKLCELELFSHSECEIAVIIINNREK